MARIASARVAYALVAALGTAAPAAADTVRDTTFDQEASRVQCVDENLPPEQNLVGCARFFYSYLANNSVTSLRYALELAQVRTALVDYEADRDIPLLVNRIAGPMTAMQRDHSQVYYTGWETGEVITMVSRMVQQHAAGHKTARLVPASG